MTLALLHIRQMTSWWSWKPDICTRATACNADTCLLQVGALKDISILRDQNTGTSRGCAFAVFEDQTHAEAAIDKLDKKLTLPGASQLMEVYFSPASLQSPRVD